MEACDRWQPSVWRDIVQAVECFVELRLDRAPKREGGAPRRVPPLCAIVLDRHGHRRDNPPRKAQDVKLSQRRLVNEVVAHRTQEVQCET